MMKVMVRYGLLHTFYRPRNWGDGSNEAQWATPANLREASTAAVAAKLNAANTATRRGGLRISRQLPGRSRSERARIQSRKCRVALIPVQPFGLPE